MKDDIGSAGEIAIKTKAVTKVIAKRRFLLCVFMFSLSPFHSESKSDAQVSRIGDKRVVPLATDVSKNTLSHHTE